MSKQKAFTIVFTFAICGGIASVGFAQNNQGNTSCLVVPGTYIRTDITDDENQGDDQIVLNNDGTGLFEQGNILYNFDTTGGFLPGVGAWKCGPNNTVVLTTIHYVTLGGNAPLSDAYRITHQLRFKSTDLDHPLVVNRVWVDFPLPASLPSSNFLDPNGGTLILSGLSSPRQFARVKAFPGDLTR